MATQSEQLNEDQVGKATSGYYGGLGDGTNGWYSHTRIADGGDDALGATTDAAASGNGSLIAILKYIRGIFKAEDAVATSGDLGMPALGARNDALASNASATGDYALQAIGSGGEIFATPTPPQGATQAAAVALSTAASTALETGRVVKNSAGTLYNLVVDNSNVAARFLQIHNTTAVPADGVTPVLVFRIPAATSVVLDFGRYGMRFTTGISVCFSTTLGTKTLGTADMWVVANYK